MQKMTIREAARVFDVSRPTLSKRIKEGKVSAEATGDGGWLIDPAEMVRAGYKARLSVKSGQNQAGQLATIAGVDVDNGHHIATHEIEELKQRLVEAERRASVAEALAQERAERIEDLRRMLPPPDAPRKRWKWW